MAELGGVFVIDPKGAFAVSDREFGFAAEGNRADDGTVGGVDGGGIFAAAIEGEDALGGGVINDGVGISVGFYGADGFQSFEIEDGDSVGAAVAGEAAAEVGGDSDAVHALRVGNVAFDGVGVGVHDYGVRGVGDVDAARVAVDVDVVPAFIAGDGNGLDDVVAGGAGLGGGVRKCRGAKNDGGRECSEAEQGETFAHSFFSSFCWFVRTTLGIALGR